MCVLSHVPLFAQLWTIAYQVPLSMGFSRQEYWSELPFPPPRRPPGSSRDQYHPHGKEMLKSKMAVWGGLINSCERREGKSKGEKERYKHLNAEFQRIARRDKKAFLSDQCKEIQENNRIGTTRDLFKKIRDTKGTFHANMGSIKDRNGMDLTEAEDIKEVARIHRRTVQKRSSQPR